MTDEMSYIYDVAVITPIYNAAEFLPACLQSIFDQTFTGSIQLCAYNDASTDNSVQVLEEWRGRLESRGISLIVIIDCSIIQQQQTTCSRGPGYARNRAIEASQARFLCFQDADDIMHRQRIEVQYSIAMANPNSLIGSRFIRDPPTSTQRYSAWANHITSSQLITQAYTSHGPTIILPTWFCSTCLYHRVPGGFIETEPNAAEDYVFFIKHLEHGGAVIRCPEVLLTYRCHGTSLTNTIPEETIWRIRVDAVCRHVISQWKTFTIWNAGKQGRRFYRSLDRETRAKVVAFCDVDVKKISKGRYVYEECSDNEIIGANNKKTGVNKPVVPIVHYSIAKPPFILCVKLDLTGGAFEKNLESLNLTEGIDYYHFS